MVNRRTVTIGFLAALTGCNGDTVTESPSGGTSREPAQSVSFPSETGRPTSFLLFTEQVDNPAADATVVGISEPILDGDTVVRKFARETVEDGGFTRRLHETVHERLTTQLADLPEYDAGRGGSYHVRYDETVVRLTIVVQEQ